MQNNECQDDVEETLHDFNFSSASESSDNGQYYCTYTSTAATFSEVEFNAFSDEDENIQDRSSCSANESDSERLDLSYSADSSQFQDV